MKHPTHSILRGAAVLLVAGLLTFAACGGGGQSSGSSGAPAGGGTSGGSTPITPPAVATPVNYFGVQTHFGQGAKPALVGKLTEGGIADVRDELYWEIVEPQAGQFQWPAAYDTFMSTLHAAGIAPLVELTFENGRYDGGQTPYTAAGFAGYARYATTLLEHYPEVRAVEVWNEYNGSFAKGPATQDRAGTYTRMLGAAYDAIKASHPDVTVVGGGTAGVPLPYFEKIFAAGGLAKMDAVSIHPYRTDFPPEGLEDQIAALRALMTRYGGGDKPIWVTEIGWGVRPPAANGDIDIDPNRQAAFLVRAFTLLVSAGVHHVYWYQFRDDSSGATMGLVQSDGTTARPAFAALRTLNDQLRTARFVARDATAPDFYSLRFTTAAGATRRVLWSLTPVTINLPAGSTAVDMTGGAIGSGALTLAEEPIYVTGNVGGLPSASSAYTPVTDAEAAFSSTQGGFGWSYGTYQGAATDFQPLTLFRVTDFKEEWADNAYRSLSLTAFDQHPSRSGNTPIAAVRRWTSTVDGRIRLSGRFRVDPRGDGVRARILIDGQLAYTANLGPATSILGEFDFTRDVHVGTRIDFAIDPGAANQIDHDATQTSIAIERTSP